MTVAEREVKRKFRLVSDHVVTHDDEYHEWVEIGKAVYLDSIGRRQKHGGMHRWMRVICNNIDCPGEVLFNSDAVIQEITQWIGE